MPKDVIYKTLNMNFRPHPLTGNLSTLSNIDAIKQSVKILVMTNKYEKLFKKNIFSNIPYSLFENIDSADLLVLKQNIKNIINNFEPRAEVIDILVRDNLDNNAFTITIKFVPQNALETTTVDVFLERIR